MAISKINISGTEHEIVAGGVTYCTCDTAAATVAKVAKVVSGNFTLFVGARVVIKFAKANSAANPTLTIVDADDNTLASAKSIIRYGTTAISTGTTSSGWIDGAMQAFTYDGTNWVQDYWYNSTYSNASLGQGYATCSTAAATVAKAATLSSYSLAKGGIVAVKFTYAVPANATLNINSKGAKKIYYRGAAIIADIIKAGDIATFIYDGTQYHLISIDRWQVDLDSKMTKSNPTGTGSFSLNRKVDTTIGTNSFAAGYNTTASGTYSHAEGYNTTASGTYSHAEGQNTTASSQTSHAEGYKTDASNSFAHAEGYETTASGMCSHAEGTGTTASKDEAHAEGSYTTASEISSHAEGYHTTASGKYSHAEGSYTIASGIDSHAEGANTTAYAKHSHAEGSYTTANSKSQHVQGEYNILDTEMSGSRGFYAHIVGNGTADDARSNAHTLDWSGNAWFAGDIYVGSTSGTHIDSGSKKLATVDDIANSSEVFVATYGTTAYADIIAAKNAGKLCICSNGDNYMTESTILSYYDVDKAVFSSLQLDGTMSFYIVTKNNAWSFEGGSYFVHLNGDSTINGHLRLNEEPVDWNDAATKQYVDNSVSSHNHSASNITSGTLAVARGGTGVTANPSMLTNLGSTSAASVFAASPRPGVTGTLGLANGGTGATSASAARSSLSVYSKTETDAAIVAAIGTAIAASY